MPIKTVIFHLFGCQCAGKSYVVSKVKKKNKDIVSWDTLESFYVPHGVIDKDNKMDWDVWRKKINLMPAVLEKFVEDNQNKHIIIESTGMNRLLNSTIKKYDVCPVFLASPTEKILIKRAIERGIKTYMVLNMFYAFNKRFDKIKHKLPEPKTNKQAINLILSKIRAKEMTNG